MISKKKKVLGSLATVFGVIALLVAGLLTIYFTSRQVPFSFSDEKLQVATLKSHTNFGNYKLVSDFPLGNPVENNKTITVFLGKDASYANVGDNVSFMAVSETASDYDALLGSLVDQQCQGESYTEGAIGVERYFYALCGGDSFYVYKNEQGWILFSTPDGDAALREIIASYV